MAALILYPAIDIQNGRCVRLLRGDLAAATIYNPDPANQAAHFAAQGFRWLHIVDVDGLARERHVLPDWHGAAAWLEIDGDGVRRRALA